MACSPPKPDPLQDLSVPPPEPIDAEPQALAAAGHGTMIGTARL
jgi:hypothetical protein